MIRPPAGLLVSARRTIAPLSACVGMTCAGLGVVATVGVASASANSTGVLTVFAGTPGTPGAPSAGPANSQAIGESYSVAVDSSGNVYVADKSNSEVEKITPAGALSVIAGDGTSGYPSAGSATGTSIDDPEGVAVDAAGDVFIADIDDHIVEEVTPAGMLSIVAGNGTQGAASAGSATSSDLSEPAGVAVDAQGDLFIADAGNNQVYKVTSAGTLSIFAGNSAGTSGSPVPGGPATSSYLDQPHGVLTAPDGDVYIADTYNSEVEQVTPAGTLTIVAGSGTSGYASAGPATSSALFHPESLAMDPAGNLYIADFYDISEVSPAGALTVVAGSRSVGAPTYGGLATATPLYYPGGVAVTPAGRLYIADSYNYTVDEVASPLPVSTLAPTVSGTATSGQTLSATTGTWTQSPTAYTYHWQLCDSTGANCVEIPGATSSTYTLTGSDIGHTVRVDVTAENSGGSVAADSAVSAVIAVVSTPSTSPTPTTSPTAGVNTTTAAGKVNGQSAKLDGTVAAHSSAVSYRFQFGVSRHYRRLTAVATLAASTSAEPVAMAVARLVPGTTYHYRLVVISGSGAISYGATKNLRTARVTPSRMGDHVSADGHGQYRVRGRMVLVHGLSNHTGCKTRGALTVSVTRDGKVIARHRVRVSSRCAYTTEFSFAKGNLPTAGRVSVHVTFAGNRQLRTRRARTLRVG